MHLINQENYPEAQEAIRDILQMYIDLAGDQYFIHNVDVAIRFDPLKYVDARPDHTNVYYVDLGMLQAGSALAIVAMFHTYWSEEHGVSSGARTNEFVQAIRGGRLAHLQDIEEVLLEFLKGEHADIEDPWFDVATKPLIDAYVTPFFQALVPANRQGTGTVRS